MKLTDYKKLTILAPDRYISDDKFQYVGTDEMWSKLPANFWALNYPCKGKVDVEFIDDGEPSNVIYDSLADVPFKGVFDWVKFEDTTTEVDIETPFVAANVRVGTKRLARELTLMLKGTGGDFDSVIEDLAKLAVESQSCSDERLKAVETELEQLRTDVLELVDAELFGLSTSKKKRSK